MENKIALEALDIKHIEEVKKFVFNGQEVHIKQYLGLSSKQEIIDYALLTSRGLPWVNRLVSDALFSYLVVAYYTNIELTSIDTEEVIALYDAMETSGLIDAVFAGIPSEEMSSLVEAYEKAIEGKNTYSNSLAGSVADLVNQIPDLVEVLTSSLGELDNLKNLDILRELSASAK